MKGVLILGIFMVVLAILWSATLAKPTDDAWLAELKDDILKTKLR